MQYYVVLQLNIQNGQWIRAGETHVIPWAFRDLIAASSGWVILNEENFGPANDFISRIQIGIYELSQSPDSFRRFEVAHGFGTIQETLLFYEGLLNDCKDHPSFDLYGYIGDTK